MPLLMCPNDNSPMQSLDRNGVQFDMCPTCRGVWLDRGELETLMASAVDEGRASTPASAPQPAPAPAPQPRPWNNAPDYGDTRGYRDDRRRDDGYHYKKKKRDSIFDIFD